MIFKELELLRGGEEIERLRFSPAAVPLLICSDNKQQIFHLDGGLFLFRLSVKDLTGYNLT
ncbi:MAG: hypothetical protein KJ804_15965 [Proteobacteria bacterium]|nr:hypothetical protein [Pseudomonadota bacterium]MBU1059808.1 hypothetical protein [Pseudomonadota bacterium]